MDKHTAVPTPLTASAVGSDNTMDTMTSALYTTTPEKPFSTYSPSTTSTPHRPVRHQLRHRIQIHDPCGQQHAEYRRTRTMISTGR